MRQATTILRTATLVAGCGALLTACGGGGSSGGTAQSIDFSFPGTHYLAVTPTALTATSTSGLAVTYASNTPTVCTISDGKVVPVSAGECSVTASQSGDSTYAAATPTQQLFKILQHPQAITFPSPGFQALGSAPAPLAATADSGLAVSYTSMTPDVCTVSGSTLTLVANGQCAITASQPGDTDYAAATAVTVKFLVGDAPPPVLTFASGYASASATLEGGSISTFAGSNKDGWWCSDPNWCSASVSADGTSFTYSYAIQPSDPNHPNSDSWIGGYYGFQIFAPGVTGFSTTANTTAGIQIDKQASVKFALAEDPTWYSTISSGAHNADVKVTLILGHFALKASNNNSPCNVAVQAVMTPASASSQTYELQLTAFTAFAESCGLSNLDAATELTTYPIVQMKFESATTNTSASTTTPTDPSYPTAITLTGAITFQ